MIITVFIIFSVVALVTARMVPLSIPLNLSATITTTGDIATRKNLGLCVAPAGNAVGNGVPVQLASCNQGGDPWLYDDSKKTFSLAGTNQCLDVKDGVNADGTRLQIWECVNPANQQFDLLRIPHGTITRIRWVGKNKCVDVTNGVFAPGTPLQIWDCLGNINQDFIFPETPPRIKFRTTTHPQLCIDVRGGSSADGTPLQIFTCNTTPAQVFQPADGGFHVFANSAIDLTNGIQSNGNKLQIWTAVHGNTNQLWIYDTFRRAIRLTINPNKCIDVTDGVFAAGTRLQIWDCNFGPNQQFTAV